MVPSKDPEVGLNTIPVKTYSLAEIAGPLTGPPQSAEPLPEENVEARSNASIMNPHAPSSERHRVLAMEEYSMRAGWGKDLQERGGFSAIEVLYRHNLLWARANLFKHFVRRREFLDWADPEVSKEVQKDLGSYTKAVTEYHEFRNSGLRMFKDQENLMKIGAYLAHLDQLSFFAESEKDPKEVKSRKEAILQGRWVLSSHYSEQVLGQTKSGVRYTNERNAQKAFYSRSVMAVGGFALLVPMLIMTLHSSKVTSLVTTSVFVLAGAVSLAWFMDTAELKDTIGATAAYAAVLVVFVGVGTLTPAGS